MIEDVINGIDGIVTSLAQTNYAALAGDVGTLLTILSSIAFVLLTLNMIIQMIPASFGAYVVWAAKALLVTAAASQWAFFQPIYDSVIALADGVSALFLGGATLTQGLQQTSDALWASYDTLSRGAGLNIGIHLTALLVAIIAIALTCAAIMVIGVAKMVLALTLGMAPLFIMSLMFKSTSDLFGAWTKVTMGAVLTIILTAGVVSIVSALLANATADALGATDLQGMLVVLVTAVAVTYIMIQAPQYAMALSGSLAAGGMSLVSAARGAISMMQSTASTAGSAAGGAYTAASVGGSMSHVYRNSIASGKNASEAGKDMAAAFTKSRIQARTTGSGTRLRAAAKDQAGRE